MPSANVRLVAALWSMAALTACSTVASPSPDHGDPTEPPGLSESPTVAATPAPHGDIALLPGPDGWLVDPAGMTLYVKAGDSTSAPSCTGECLVTWPPFEVPPGTGVLGPNRLEPTFQHPEGFTQVTYQGQPLYYYSGDTAPGEANGDGLGGVWSVAKP